MIAIESADEALTRSMADLLRPDLLVDGFEPEERVVHCGISWDRYLALDNLHGEDRSGPRFYYLDGELEIMTTSNEHERIKKWIGDLLAIYFEEKNVEVITRGQATLRDAFKQAGAEPDDSWCLRETKPFPDIALEIALTSGGVRKLEAYRRFGVPEVWLRRRGSLEVFGLNDQGTYESIKRSRLLPNLDIQLLERCVGIPSWLEARKTFRAALSERQ